MLALAAGVTAIASDFLTEGVDNGADRMGPRREDLHDRERRPDDAPVEGEAREHATRDAQPVRAAGGRARHARRRARARSPSSPASPTICSASTWRRGNRSGTGVSTAPSRNQEARTTRSVPAARPRCRRWRRHRPGKYTVYAVSWDGRLRQVNLADGVDVAPPEKFIPGGGKPYALNLHDGVIYTATAQGCGGLTNAFYSFDLATPARERVHPGRRRSLGPSRRRDRS